MPRGEMRRPHGVNSIRPTRRRGRQRWPGQKLNSRGEMRRLHGVSAMNTQRGSRRHD